MPQVFISHSSADDAFVTRLGVDLRAVSVPTWVDHENIPAGADWDTQVGAALKACSAMIVVLSPQAVISRNVTDEWSLFFDLKKPIYPVMVAECEVPFRLLRVQRINFTGEYDPAFAALLKVIKAAAAAEAPTMAGLIAEYTRLRDAGMPLDDAWQVIAERAALLPSHQQKLLENVVGQERQGFNAHTDGAKTSYVPPVPDNPETNVVPMPPVKNSQALYFGENHVLYLAVEGVDRPLRVQVGDAPLTIGRQGSPGQAPPGIDLSPYRAAELGVSRHHATLARRENTLVLIDNGSMNATLINSVRLHPHETRVLQDGDELYFGQLKVQIMFRAR